MSKRASDTTNTSSLAITKEKLLMKSIVLPHYGVHEVLREQDIAEPERKETQVLVEMYATSINPGDYVLRSGAAQHIMPIQFPYVLGTDVAGVVKEVGEKVTSVKPG